MVVPLRLRKIMDRRKFVAALATTWMVLAAIACVDATGPPPGSSALGDLALLASVAGDDGTTLETRIIQQSASVPPLETYSVSFWARKDKDRSATIRYQDGDTFLSLLIPRKSLKKLPNGQKVGKNDSVLVTITVDPVRFLVSLEPSGLQFDKKRRAELFLNYAGANPDFDLDGDTDQTDQLIEQYFLGMWSKEGGDPWDPIEFEQSVEDQWFLGLLLHFSDHAISW